MNSFHNMQVNFIENDFCKQWIDGNTICCIFKPYLEIDMVVIKKCVSDRLILSKGAPFTLLADVKYLKYFTSEAREYFASTEGSKDLLAIAFVASTQIEKFIIKLFIDVNRPKVQCNIFSNKEEALKWLEEFKR